MTARTIRCTIRCLWRPSSPHGSPAF